MLVYGWHAPTQHFERLPTNHRLRHYIDNGGLHTRLVGMGLRPTLHLRIASDTHTPGDVLHTKLGGMG